MEKNYHALIPGKIFMGGAADVQQMVDQEGIEVVVDLRGEAEQCAAAGDNLSWVMIPLGDEAQASQADLFKDAILAVTSAYQEGKKVAFHCNGGRGRTGTVAYGTLLELGLADSIGDAESKAQSIRPALSLKPAQRESLEALYEASAKNSKEQ